jgi:protein SCO1/2
MVPLSFFVIAKWLKKDRINLPRYYQALRVDSQNLDGRMQYDTVFRQTPELTLQNQLGDIVSLNKDLSGKILVIDFIFTNCPDVCPRLTSNIALLQKAFRKDKKKEEQATDEVQFISVSVDPARDSFPALRAYADRYKADHDRWWFLTGDKKLIYDYARNVLGVSVQPGNGGAEDFIHTEKIVLLDGQRYIRGYYDGLDPLQMQKCADDIILLTREKKKTERSRNQE